MLWQTIEGCVCAGRPGASAPAAAAGVPPKPRRRTGNEVDELQHPLLGDQPTLQLLPPRDAVGARTCLICFNLDEVACLHARCVFNGEASALLLSDLYYVMLLYMQHWSRFLGAGVRGFEGLRHGLEGQSSGFLSMESTLHVAEAIVL